MGIEMIGKQIATLRKEKGIDFFIEVCYNTLRFGGIAQLVRVHA